MQEELSHYSGHVSENLLADLLDGPIGEQAENISARKYKEGHGRTTTVVKFWWIRKARVTVNQTLVTSLSPIVRKRKRPALLISGE